MKFSDIPLKLTIPFGNSAGSGYIRTIPVSSQIGVQNGAASLTDGFPPLNFLPVGSGGVPPFGQDMNGILNEISAWSRWQAAGALCTYDSDFSTAVGGYPKGAVLLSTTTGILWLNTVDDNTTNPDSGGTGWVRSGGWSPSYFSWAQPSTTIPNNAVTQVAGWGSHSSSGDSTFNPSAGSVTIGTLDAGIWSFTSSINTVGSGTAELLAIRINGTNRAQAAGVSPTTDAADLDQATSLTVPVAAGDVITATYFQTNSTSANATLAAVSQFSGARVG